MKNFFKDNWKFLLIVLFGGLLGGYCTGVYGFDSLSKDLLKQMQDNNITKEMVVISAMFQYALLYGVLLASIGILLSKKIKLWKEFKLSKKAIFPTIIISIVGALILFPGDKIIFGSLSTWVYEQYTLKPTIYKIISGILIGGIIEEVMMRLFFMSFTVFIISKLFFNNKMSTLVFAIANILAALLFAAGHLPSTATMTTLTPLIIFRCFLFNGGLGIAFGHLYRKYGIGYAMISHGLCHLIADIFMIIFI